MKQSIRKMLALTLGCALAAPIALAGCGGGRPQYDFEAERKATKSHSVGPGDVLQVRAWKNEALTQRVTVRPDGYVTLPLVGDVHAAGKGVEQIASAISEAAKRYYNEPQMVSVEVAELHSYRIYVTGEVSRPGEFTPKGEVTVLQAIALAGGFTRFAAPDSVVIVRRDSSGARRIPFAYNQVVQNGDLRENLPLQRDDTVVVP